MAARENQGLQIAVMIFFLLVVLLAVTTYVFFKNYDDTLKRLAEAEKTARSETQTARRVQTENNRYKELMGYSAEDTLETVEAEFTKDMDTFAVGYQDEKKYYRQVLQYLHNDKQQIVDRETSAKSREEDLKGKIATTEATKDKQIDEFKSSMDKISQDLAGERTKFNDDRAKITKNADDIARQLDGKRTEMSNLVAKTNSQVKDLSTRVTKLDQLNKQKTKLLRTREDQGVDSPDGRVTWVNQRTNTVWVNLGQGDNLQRQTVFSIYPTDVNNATIDQKKGSIEITRVIDEHMAEGRILDDDLSNPILPGDKIHSPIWNRGLKDGFALVGFMDIDGDGRSDREKVRDLISLNGGEIDAELLDDGKIQGKLKLTTKYIILGETPTAKTKNAELIDNYSLLTGEAQQLGVETLALNKFMAQLGWKPDERTIQLGKGANPDDFKARPAEGVQRRSTGATSEQFQKRARPRSTY
jgi:hypothetical protein